MEKIIENLKAAVADITADKNKTDHHNTALALIGAAIERLGLVKPAAPAAKPETKIPKPGA
jgi:hypothetical protein